MKIPFIKAHGAGNDFVIIDKNVDIIRKSKKMIKRLCDRRFGVGCDQLIMIKCFFTTQMGLLEKTVGMGFAVPTNI